MPAILPTPGPALNRLNTAIVRRLRAEGAVVPSTTIVGGRCAIRPCYINPRTRESDVDLLAERVATVGDGL